MINPTEEQFSEWMQRYYPPPEPQPSRQRRLADLAQQEAMLADLAQTQDPENAAIMQRMAPQPQEMQPMNTIRTSSGRTISLPSIQEQGGMSLNDLLNKTGASINDKVIIQDKGVGYRTPYGSVAGLDSNGRMWKMDKPQKPTVTTKQMKEYWEMVKAQKEAEAMSNPATAQMPKLKPGERWNAEKQAVEAVPGSDVYVKQSGLHGKDYAALQGVNQKMDFAIDRVNELLDPNNKDMIERNFGGYNAYISQFLPGAGVAGKNRIEALKSTLKNAGLEMMRTGGSIGQMTEREWPIVEKMLANINPTLSEKDAELELQKVGTFLKNLKDNAGKAYETEWGNTQFYKPAANNPEVPQTQPKANLTLQDRQAMNWAMQNRNDPRAQKIMQKIGVQ